MDYLGSFFKKSYTTHRYHITNENDESKEETFESDSSLLFYMPPYRYQWFSWLPWILTFFFAFLSLFLYGRPSSRISASHLGSFENGWETDFDPAKAYIQVEQVRFTGSPAFDENNTYYVPNPDPIQYVGKPSPEIDAAWEELTWGRYILISEEEAKETLIEPFGDISQFWSPRRGGYVGGFDIFHTLHCLDRLRKALEPDYYVEQPHPNHIIHRYHCIEQIRQYIMCAGDMSLTPTPYHPLRKSSYVDSDVKHTCRAFGPLREFLSERYNGSKAVQPICPDGKTFPERGSKSCLLEDNTIHGVDEHGM